MRHNGVPPQATACCHYCWRNRQVVEIAQEYIYLYGVPQKNLPDDVRRVTGTLSCGHPFAVIVPLAFVVIMREWMPEKGKADCE